MQENNNRAGMMNDMPAGLEISIHCESGEITKPFIRKNLLAAHAILKPPLVELSLAVVDDAKMSELHYQFMKIRGPTDVLTFELDHNNSGKVTGGEVIICLPYAERQAEKTGVPVRNEVLLYAIHGMLHLCGFDDRTPGGFKKMHAMEDAILTQLGIGAVFLPGPESARPRRLRQSRRTDTGSKTSRRFGASGIGDAR